MNKLNKRVGLLEELKIFFNKTEKNQIDIIEQVDFHEFSVFTCKEHCINPITFNIIATNGKFYSSNFDDIAKLHKGELNL
jgi:hypothetical protein